MRGAARRRACRIFAHSQFQVTVADDMPNCANPMAAFVSATQKAQGLDLSRSYTNRLESETILQRSAKGYPLGASIIAYIGVSAARATTVTTGGRNRRISTCEGGGARIADRNTQATCSSLAQR